MTDLGELSLWIALLMAVWGAALSCAGGALGRDDLAASGARGLIAAALFVAIASTGLWWALLTDDFGLRHVAMFSSAALPTPYKLSAFWAGRAGSVLLLAMAFAACAAVAIAANRRRNRELMPWVAATLGAILALVLLTAVMRANPFARLAMSVEDGRGLDPRLQNVAAAAYVPLAYCGYAAALGAGAFTAAAFMRCRYDAEWRRTLRAWMLAAWCLAGSGSLLALRIEYLERRTGGFAAGGLPGIPGLVSGVGAGLSLVIAMAVLVAGTRSVGGWARLRREGRYALIAGTTLLATGIAGAAFGSKQVVTLGDGETVRAKDPFGREWSFTSQGASRIERPNHLATAVSLRASRGGARARFITSERREYYGPDDREQFAPYTTSGFRVSPLQDVVVTLQTAREGKAVVRIAFVPLALWTWIGGAALVIGGALVVWPTASKVEGIA